MEASTDCSNRFESLLHETSFYPIVSETMPSNFSGEIGFDKKRLAPAGREQEVGPLEHELKAIKQA